MRKFLLFLPLYLLFCNLHGQNYKFGKVSKEELLEQQHPLEHEANAAVLFREHRTYYHINPQTGFSLVTEVHERVKIYTKDGFEWANKEISYFRNGNDQEKISGVKGVTYNLENGKIREDKLRKDGIFEEEVTDYKLKTTLAMPAVTEGSVIEYRYTLRSPFVTSIDIIPLQYTIPVNRLETRVSIPEFFGFKKHINPKSAVHFPIEESRRNETYRTGTRSSGTDYMVTTYSIEANEIPALKEENYIDYLHNYAAYLQWELEFTKFPNSPYKYFSQTWEEVATTIYKDGGYGKELDKTRFFEDDLDELLQGASTIEEKIARIYDFVKEKIKWDSYLGYRSINGIRTAYKEGEGNVGDINLVLVSMLRYAGINANPVLVSTRNNGIPVYPTRDGFNYVIAGVEAPNEVILLDATDLTAAPGELPKRASNWQGRIIRENGSSTWVNLMPQYQSEETIVMNLKLQENLMLQGKSMKILKGLQAKDHRDKYRSVDEEKYMETLHTNKGNIRITSLEKENEDLPGKEIKETYDFELENGVERINGKIYIKPLLFLAQKENPFKAAERTYPIFLKYPYVTTATVNIMIPEGYRVESIPENFASELNAGEGSFTFVASQSGNFLRIQSVVDFKNIVFNPRDYNALKGFFDFLIEKQTESIVISKI